MTESQQIQQQLAPQGTLSASGIHLDQHAGHGGSYVVDPETSERTLVERTNTTGISTTKASELASIAKQTNETVGTAIAVPQETLTKNPSKGK